MKANELMIGDWVHYWILNINAKVNDVMSTGRLGIRFIDPKGKEGYIHGVICETVKPIPLAAEILEKNGFVEFMPNNWQIVIDNIMIELRAPEPNMAIWLDWVEHDTGTYASYMFPRPNYVHELQHALRLCGIEKEIEL